MKLAEDPSVSILERTLIETRGEGGYALAPGCPAECHETKRLYEHACGPDLCHLSDITPEEREVLLRCARYFDRKPAQQEKATTGGNDLRPGDDYDQRGPDWEAILGPHGWVCTATSGNERRWRRPGKDGRTWSATTGHCNGKNGEDLFRVFSSNAEPFQPEKAYGKFRAYALLNHAGDLAAAARELGRQGFGTGPRKQYQYHTLGNGTDTTSVGGLVLIPCSELKATPAAERWVLDGYLARASVTLLSALFKCGKTTLLAHLFREMEEGGLFAGRGVKPCKVLVVTEEHQSRWAERRDALGLKDHLTFIVRPFGCKPTPKEWFAFLEQLREVQQREQFDLIIFDTLTNLWPVRDENNAAEVQAALMPLHEVIGDAALALVHHLRKSDGNEGTASRGSGALASWVDIIVELRRLNPQDREDTRRVLTGYGRFEQTPAELVVNLQEGAYVAEGSKAEAQTKELVELVAGVLPSDAEKAKTVKEILDDWPRDADPNRNQLYAALKAGRKDQRWDRVGKGTRGDPHRYYRLPAEESGKEEVTR
jgi:hypothetical protein